MGRAICRRSYPAGLEMVHEPAPADAPSLPSANKLSWLRSVGTRSIFEKVAQAEADASRAKQRREAATRREVLAVGDAVCVEFRGPRGGIYNAHVAAVHRGGESYTLDWANGELTQRVQPAQSVRRRMQNSASLAPEPASASAAATAAPPAKHDTVDLTAEQPMKTPPTCEPSPAASRVSITSLTSA